MWIKKIKTILPCWTAFSTFLLLCACDELLKPAFYNRAGIGPSNWNNIWFINRFMDINAAIMKPYGINDWRALGLPVEGSKALTHELALARIDECLADVTACVRK